MALTASNMTPLGSQLQPFSLTDGEGNFVSSEDIKMPNGLLVLFTCNHCPFSMHISSYLSTLNSWLENLKVGMIAVNSNDIEAYPQDAPELMAKRAQEHQYNFPYVYDEDQLVAKELGAACTPDFFLFDNKSQLIYRGQLDASRPGNGIPLTGKDLKEAVELMISGKTVSKQNPSVGCNIKWKAA